MSELIITSANAHEYIKPPRGKGKGYVKRDFTRIPHGSMRCAPAADPADIIPRRNWSDLIKQQESDESRTSDIIRRAKMPAMDQEQTEFCWGYAPVGCVQVLRCLANEPLVLLSPASVCCKINGFQNRGGLGPDALQYIAAFGVCSVDVWPANAIDRKYDTPEAAADRLYYRVTAWDDLEPRNFEQMATRLLRNIPVAGGYDWMEHEIMLCDLVELSADVFGIRFRQSYGSDFGDDGFAILTEEKGTADDAVAPRVALA